MMNEIKNACEKSGRTFRLMTTDPQEESHYFNPLQGFYPISEASGKTASTLVGSLGLDHGLGYGRGHFSQQNISVALDALEDLKDRVVLRPTLEEFAKAVRRISRNQKGAGAELASVLRLLSTYEKLDSNVGPGIDIAEAIERREIVYFYVETLFQPAVRSVGAFAIFAIIGEMIRRSRLGLEPRHSLIVIDELATIARLSAYAEILTLVRKHNVSLLMANQSTSQLEATDMNLANIIRENSMTRVYLTPIADDEASLQLESKDVVRNRASRTSSGFFSESTTERDEVEPVLTRNEIKEVSATAFHGFAIFDDGTGHQDPIPFSFEPPTLSDHVAQSRKPIPRRAMPTVQTPKRQQNPQRVQEVRSLIEALMRTEEWKPSQGKA